MNTVYSGGGTFKTSTQEKPPQGVIPKDLWDAQRKQDIKDAIIRYMDAGKQIPIGWMYEYNSLCKAESGGVTVTTSA